MANCTPTGEVFLIDVVAAQQRSATFMDMFSAP